jgi:hypothetical protein
VRCCSAEIVVFVSVTHDVFVFLTGTVSGITGVNELGCSYKFFKNLITHHLISIY